MSEPKDVRDILDKLVVLSELIEQHRATLFLLEQEKRTLQSALRATAFKAPAPDPQGALPL